MLRRHLPNKCRTGRVLRELPGACLGTAALGPQKFEGSLNVKLVIRMLLTGLVAILPVAVTLYVLYWLGSTAESFLGRGLKLLVPDNLYWPGMGVAAGLGVVFATGVLMKMWLFRRLLQWGERLVARVPLVKTLYGAVRDLLGFFSGAGQQALRKAVIVTIAGTPLRLIGFVTREDFGDLPAGIGGDGNVAVYLPMSYQVGGFTALVPRSAVVPVDMSIEQAMRFALTAGMSAA